MRSVLVAVLLVVVMVAAFSVYAATKYNVIISRYSFSAKNYDVYIFKDRDMVFAVDRYGHVVYNGSDLAEAVDASIANGYLSIYVMRGEYILHKPITVVDGMKLVGEEPSTNSSLWIDKINNLVNGTILIGNGDFPAVTGVASNIMIKNLGFVNFSYGIRLGESNKLIGFVNLENLYFKDIRHWAIEVINLCRSTFRRIYGNLYENTPADGGFIHLVANHTDYVIGNDMFEEIFARVPASAIGLFVETAENSTDFNLLTITSIQFNAVGEGNGTGIYMKGTPSSKVSKVNVFSVDIENYGTGIKTEYARELLFVLLKPTVVELGNETRYTIIMGSSATVKNYSGYYDHVALLSSFDPDVNLEGSSIIVLGRDPSIGKPILYYNGKYINTQEASGEFKFLSHVHVYGRVYFRTAGNVTVPANSSNITVSIGYYMPDNNYLVFALPTWDTSVYVLSKSNSNFVLGFSNPPESTGEIYWFIIYKQS